MPEADRKLMEEAITWASACKPIKESIPRVGAIIAVDGVVIGRGRRGSGVEGDDNHAEHVALASVSDKTALPNATLYSTLEPCTPDVRTKGSECCTELIVQHRLKRVFVGTLDPNQGVTGKGLFRLQDAGVDVSLFPHGLAQKIRALNVEFIRAQQTLGATIISPTHNESLKTYETQGKHAVRFKCINPPSVSNYLVSFREGVCWPHGGAFRQVDKDKTVWEIDAHFGSPGEHTLHIVTANDLGRTLVEFYRLIVRSNIERRKRIKKAWKDGNLDLLGGDYPGIPMNGPPKGFRSEASVTVTVVAKP